MSATPKVPTEPTADKEDRSDALPRSVSMSVAPATMPFELPSRPKVNDSLRELDSRLVAASESPSLAHVFPFLNADNIEAVMDQESATPERSCDRSKHYNTPDSLNIAALRLTSPASPLSLATNSQVDSQVDIMEPIEDLSPAASNRSSSLEVEPSVGVRSPGSQESVVTPVPASIATSEDRGCQTSEPEHGVAGTTRSHSSTMSDPVGAQVEAYVINHSAVPEGATGELGSHDQQSESVLLQQTLAEVKRLSERISNLQSTVVKGMNNLGERNQMRLDSMDKEEAAVAKTSTPPVVQSTAPASSPATVIAARPATTRGVEYRFRCDMCPAAFADWDPLQTHRHGPAHVRSAQAPLTSPFAPPAHSSPLRSNARRSDNNSTSGRSQPRSTPASLPQSNTARTQQVAMPQIPTTSSPAPVAGPVTTPAPAQAQAAAPHPASALIRHSPAAQNTARHHREIFTRCLVCDTKFSTHAALMQHLHETGHRRMTPDRPTEQKTRRGGRGTGGRGTHTRRAGQNGNGSQKGSGSGSSKEADPETEQLIEL